MGNTPLVYCPNCDSEARRHYFYSGHSDYQECPQGRVTHTECSICFYLMVIGTLNGHVIKSNVPEISASIKVNHSNRYCVHGYPGPF
jgi:hypothetical protein